MQRNDTSPKIQEVYDVKIRGLTGRQRFLRGLSLTHWSRQMCLAGLRVRYPQAAEDEVRRIFLEKVYGIKVKSAP